MKLSAITRWCGRQSGHPHAVYPTSFAELVTCTGAKPMVVGD